MVIASDWIQTVFLSGKDKVIKSGFNRDDVLCLIPELVSLKINGSSEGFKLQDGVFTNMLSLYRKWKKAKSSKK